MFLCHCVFPESKGGHGFFTMCNNPSACCALGGKTDIDEFEHTSVDLKVLTNGPSPGLK